MENKYYKKQMELTYKWLENGKQEARKDFNQYQDGEVTKEQLQSFCWMAKHYITMGIYQTKCKATGYLQEMENLGFIKDQQEID